jgi:hypothetical protein
MIKLFRVDWESGGGGGMNVHLEHGNMKKNELPSILSIARMKNLSRRTTIDHTRQQKNKLPNPIDQTQDLFGMLVSQQSPKACK